MDDIDGAGNRGSVCLRCAIKLDHDRIRAHVKGKLDEPDALCTCGDVRDEHENGHGKCTVEGCDCNAFEYQHPESNAIVAS